MVCKGHHGTWGYAISPFATTAHAACAPMSDAYCLRKARQFCSRSGESNAVLICTLPSCSWPLAASFPAQGNHHNMQLESNNHIQVAHLAEPTTAMTNGKISICCSKTCNIIEEQNHSQTCSNSIYESKTPGQKSNSMQRQDHTTAAATTNPGRHSTKDHTSVQRMQPAPSNTKSVVYTQASRFLQLA